MRRGEMVRMATRRLAAVLVFTAVAGTAAAQQLYKCAGTYQDRPCADLDVQKRYAHGRFDVDQANPDTDRDCARVVSDLMPFWKRLHGGESVDTLRAEIDARPVSRQQKSEMRDLLIALREVEGNAPSARSQLETQCMAYKRTKGLPTQAQLKEAQARDGQPTSTPRTLKQRRY
jgi:hypothetical protein